MYLKRKEIKKKPIFLLLYLCVQVTFTAEITVTECPRDRAMWSRQLEIYPVGLAEKLLVNLDLICECSCEKKGQEVGIVLVACYALSYYSLQPGARCSSVVRAFAHGTMGR